jgi:hypothetical protein
LAQPQSAQQRGILGDINEWISQRNAQAGELARDAEAKGRQIWEDSIRTGRDVLGRTQSELRELGGSNSGNSKTAVAPSSTPQYSGISWLDRNPVGKAFGGDYAEKVGRTVGVARGIGHSAVGLGEGLDFVSRLLDPYDAEINGADNSAWSQAFAAGKAATDYVGKGLGDPASVGRDIGKKIHDVYVDTVPSATPVADTFIGEMKRRAGIGANQGELAWNAGTLVAGTPALKAVEGLGAAADATGAAKFMEMGFTPAKAARLTEPYNGLGHHSPVPQALADKLGLPKWLRDSSLNVVKPDDLNQGDFYEFHFQVDPYFNVARFSPKIGGGVWNGKVLGLQKYGPLGRFWYGTPTPLAGLSMATGAAGLSNYQTTQDSPQ